MEINITFTLSFLETSINFLDTVVTQQEDRLMTKLFTKPTDRNMLLHFNNAHPRSMLKSLPYSQFLRVKNIVSVSSEVDSSFNEMSHKFIKRGYPRSLVQQQKNRAQSLTRNEILVGQESKREIHKRVPFVSTYSEMSSKISKIINKH